MIVDGRGPARQRCRGDDGIRACRVFVRGAHDFTLSDWMKGVKRGIANWFTSIGKEFKWQPGFFDHLLRNDESYDRKWNYVRQNPVRANLVVNPDDWPYAGEIVYIDRA